MSNDDFDLGELPESPYSGNGHAQVIDLDFLPVRMMGWIDGTAKPAKPPSAMGKIVVWTKQHGYDQSDLVALLLAYPDGIAKRYPGERLTTQIERLWALVDVPDAPPWVQLLAKNEKGKVLTDVANCIKALESAPELQGMLGYDELERSAVMLKPAPGLLDGGGRVPHPVQDIDATGLQDWLQNATLRHLAKDTVHQAVDFVARQNSFHPVRDYLNGLAWDGTARVDKWLNYYLGVDRLTAHTALGQDYVDRVGRMFLISAVARIRQPGCQCDYVLVLEGAQGNLKSSAVNALAAPWFSDHLPDLSHNSKDVSQHLNGKWIVEIPELSALVKADSTTIKSFITRRVEQYRRSYGHRDVYEPRQCVLIGTTNEASYLRDPTGGRRFWPVKCTNIDLEALLRDRDQLWAEAVQLYKAGEKWWPDKEFERDVMMPEQEARFEEDPWVEVITGHLEVRRQTTLYAVAGALGFQTDKIGTRDVRRIAAILRSLGWEMTGKTGKVRFWEPSSRH